MLDIFVEKTISLIVVGDTMQYLGNETLSKSGLMVETTCLIYWFSQ